MHAADRPDLFAPPAAPRLLSSLFLAIVVHSMLLAALTWGVAWKRQAQSLTVEAELWAALPQEEAPPPLEPPPQVEPIAPPLALKAEAALPSEADIALAREKQRKLKEQEEQERLAREKQKQLEQERLAQEKKKKAEQDKKLALDKKKKEKEAKLKAEKEAEKLKAMRKEQLDRMMGLAGSGGADSKGKGKDAKTAGPSAGYAGRIRARIKPNIVFTDNISTNPVTEVEVRTSPDGTILNRKIIKRSGVDSWDEAVLKAIDKTEVLPRDADGQVPPALVITFRPRD